MVKVHLAKLARLDLREIHDYIAKDSYYYAKEVVRSLLLQIRNLETFPLIGRIVPEFMDESIREIIYESYRIIYRVRDDVEIAAFVHTKRDLEEAVQDRLM